MCIRDSDYNEATMGYSSNFSGISYLNRGWSHPHLVGYMDCLLYTSDAADERSSVDLGGRRIITKKNTYECHEQRQQLTKK